MYILGVTPIFPHPFPTMKLLVAALCMAHSLLTAALALSSGDAPAASWLSAAAETLQTAEVFRVRARGAREGQGKARPRRGDTKARPSQEGGNRGPGIHGNTGKVGQGCREGQCT